MKTLITLLTLAATTSTTLYAQNGSDQFREFIGHRKADVRREFHAPNIPGFQTVKADFHVHTHYSDGRLIPKERVQEAWRDGLDVIALTDHNWNRQINKTYQDALQTANDFGIGIIKSVELTDSKPVGHLNFLFVEDPASYVDSRKAPEGSVNRAAEEGAFIIYNHPGWPDRNSKLNDFQLKFLNEKKIHAMEVFNAAEFYPIAIDYCKQYNIAPIGASDIHVASEKIYDRGNYHVRPMTFVFAKDSSLEAVKEALFAKRTLAYSYGTVAGEETLLKPFFLASLSVKETAKKDGKTTYLVTNNSSIDYTLENPDYMHINLPAQSTAMLTFEDSKLHETFNVLQCFKATNTPLNISARELIQK